MNIRVLNFNHIVDYRDPNAPDVWKYTGTPSVIIIDADDPEQAKLAEQWHDLADSDPVPERQFGYELGYYPIDVETWGMTCDGPYCAKCIDPANAYSNPNTSAAEEYPQAYTAELIDSYDEDSYGKYNRYCTGCNEVMYEVDDE